MKLFQMKSKQKSGHEPKYKRLEGQNEQAYRKLVLCV